MYKPDIWLISHCAKAQKKPLQARYANVKNDRAKNISKSHLNIQVKQTSCACPKIIDRAKKVLKKLIQKLFIGKKLCLLGRNRMFDVQEKFSCLKRPSTLFCSVLF